MLIIPAMTLAGDQCSRTHDGDAGTEGRYPSDPVGLARLWRRENAKALHIEDLDARGPRIQGLIREVVGAVDIAVQFAGGLCSEEDVAVAFSEGGVYRVVIDPDALGSPQAVGAVARRFGPRKVLVRLKVHRGYASTGAETLFAAEVARIMEAAGVERIVLADAEESEASTPPPIALLNSVLQTTRLTVTVQGGVRGYPDLAALQVFDPRRLDSLILGRALYRNFFPCQRIWRDAERRLIDRDTLI
jgi:phosphoribosylformimino-5-aminoimidazole carboxamide ribotide isomerase